MNLKAFMWTSEGKPSYILWEEEMRKHENQLKLAYALLYPYIAKDFRHVTDCANTHARETVQNGMHMHAFVGAVAGTACSGTTFPAGLHAHVHATPNESQAKAELGTRAELGVKEQPASEIEATTGMQLPWKL